MNDTFGGRTGSGARTYSYDDRERTIDRLRRLAFWMDEAFAIPGTTIRIGFDSIIGFIPGIGDVVTAGFAVYLIREAARLGAPKSLLVRMAWNVGIDTVVGGVPVVGDLFDVGWKANKRNLRLLLDHLDRERSRIR